MQEFFLNITSGKLPWNSPYRTGNPGFVQNVLEADFVRRFSMRFNFLEAILIAVLVVKPLFPNITLFIKPPKPTNARKTTKILYETQKLERLYRISPRIYGASFFSRRLFSPPHGVAGELVFLTSPLKKHWANLRAMEEG